MFPTADEAPELARALPTFNSQAIETMLHRIPGLRSPFIYLNDDFFIGQRLRVCGPAWLAIDRSGARACW